MDNFSLVDVNIMIKAYLFIRFKLFIRVVAVEMSLPVLLASIFLLQVPPHYFPWFLADSPLQVSGVWALNCSMSGLCDGYLLSTGLAEDKTQCIYFCREREAGEGLPLVVLEWGGWHLHGTAWLSSPRWEQDTVRVWRAPVLRVLLWSPGSVWRNHCWWIHQSEQGKIFSSISIFHTISIRMPASRAVRRIHCVTGSPSSLTRRSAISCRTVTLSTLTVKVTFCSSTKIIISFSRLSVWPGGVSPG